MTDRDFERLRPETYLKEVENMPLEQLISYAKNKYDWANSITYTPKGTFKKEDEWYVSKYTNFCRSLYGILCGSPIWQSGMDEENIEKVIPLLTRIGLLKNNVG